MIFFGNTISGTVLLCFCFRMVFCQDRILLSNESFSVNSGNSNVVAIPEEVLIQLNDIHTTSDFIRRFITPDQGVSMIEGDFTGLNVTESRRALSPGAPMGAISQPANCQPELHVVEVEKPNNSAIMFWPSCVRVRRCGGCCPSKMLACKPLAISFSSVTVLQMKYNPYNPNSFESEGTAVFSLEQHDRCACICKELAEDCNADVHVYRINECRCACKAPEDAANCTGTKKMWDSKECMCKCRNIKKCSSGRYFNASTCRCETVRRSLGVDNRTLSNSTHLVPPQTAVTVS